MNTDSALQSSSITKPLLARITSFLSAVKKSLYSLCLVNKSFNEIASSILYKKSCVSTRSDVEVLEHILNGNYVCSFSVEYYRASLKKMRVVDTESGDMTERNLGHDVRLAPRAYHEMPATLKNSKS